MRRGTDCGLVKRIPQDQMQGRMLDVPVRQIPEDVVKVSRLVPEECISECITEQTIDVSVTQKSSAPFAHTSSCLVLVSSINIFKPSSMCATRCRSSPVAYFLTLAIAFLSFSTCSAKRRSSSSVDCDSLALSVIHLICSHTIALQSDQLQSSPVQSCPVKSSQVKSSQVKSNQIFILFGFTNLGVAAGCAFSRTHFVDASSTRFSNSGAPHIKWHTGDACSPLCWSNLVRGGTP